MNRSKLVDALKRAGAAHCLLETPAGGWALVVPRLGARILGAGVDELNAFWVSPSLEGCLEGRDWNAGGQRTWLAPELWPLGFFGTGESDWAVPPELDPGSYRLLEAGRLVLRTAPARRYKVGQHPMGTEAVIAHHRPRSWLLAKRGATN